MGEKKKPTKSKYEGEELENILRRLEERGFLNSEEEHYKKLKETILKKQKKEILELKKELDIISHTRFKDRREYLSFLNDLFHEIPPPLEP